MGADAWVLHGGVLLASVFGRGHSDSGSVLSFSCFVCRPVALVGSGVALGHPPSTDGGLPGRATWRRPHFAPHLALILALVLCLFLSLFLILVLWVVLALGLSCPLVLCLILSVLILALLFVILALGLACPCSCPCWLWSSHAASLCLLPSCAAVLCVGRNVHNPVSCSLIIRWSHSR